LDEIDLVKQILKTDLPIHAIDVNSKFEIEAGLKNKEELDRFKQKINF
jgi:phosphoribosylanthranilate isomerase